MAIEIWNIFIDSDDNNSLLKHQSVLLGATITCLDDQKTGSETKSIQITNGYMQSVLVQLVFSLIFLAAMKIIIFVHGTFLPLCKKKFSIFHTHQGHKPYGQASQCVNKVMNFSISLHYVGKIFVINILHLKELEAEVLIL